MGECFLHGIDGLPIKGLPKFTYTGEYQTVDEGNKNWHIRFLTSGILKIIHRKGATKGIEVFLVGGGGAGGKGVYVGSGTGGAGGGGGFTRTENTKVGYIEYPIVIGDSGKATTGFGYTASPGNAGGDGNVYCASGGDGTGKGGNGGGGTGGVPCSGTNGNAGVYAFGDSKYGMYGGGGGGGNGAWEDYGGAGTGGAGGGGNGGYKSNGISGVKNTGGGGGGGGIAPGGFDSSGGSGGSGIVIIRNKRS